MKIESLDDLLATLRQSGLLEEEQQEQLGALAAGFGHPAALARELERRAWLTPYQAAELLAGRGGDLVLGQYVILSLLGQGGMGKVFKARHRLMKRIVALKVINPALLQDARAIQRFHREIEAVGRLTHPNIVAAFDADYVGNTHFLVMEYVEGIDLSRLVKEHGPLPPGVACDFARQAALGLQHAHEQGMVHRDIKPHNLLVSRGPAPALAPVVKILDMGLARLHAGDVDGMTNTGAVMGTPDYIAPEQASDSHTVDIRADLYSLGCTLYLLLTGEPPFPGGTALDKVFKHKYVAPRPVEVRRPEVPPGVAAVVARLLAKRPEERYQTPAEAAEALAPLSIVDPSVLPASLGPSEVEPDVDGLVRTIRRGRPRGSTLFPEAGGTRLDAAPPGSAGPSGAGSGGGGWSDVPPPYVGPGGAAAPVAGGGVAVGELPGPRPKPVPPRPRRGAAFLMMAGLLAAVAAVAGVLAWPLLHPGPRTTGLGTTEAATSQGPTQKPDTGLVLPTNRPPGPDTKPKSDKDTPKDTPKEPTKPPKEDLIDGIVCHVQPGEPLYTVAFAANGTRVAMSTTKDHVFLCDLLTARPDREPDGSRQILWAGQSIKPTPVPAATAIAMTKDGKTVFYGTRNEIEGVPWIELRTYDAESSFPPDKCWSRKNTKDISAIALSGDPSSDDPSIAIAGTQALSDGLLKDQQDVLIWNLAGKTATFLRSFDGHKHAPITAVALSQDGTRAVSCGRFDALRRWDPRTGEEKKDAITANAGEVQCVAFSPETNRVLFGGDDRVLHLIEFDSGAKVLDFEADPQSGSIGRINAIAFSHNGKVVISGHQDGAVCLWDVDKGKQIAGWTPNHDGGSVIAVGLSGLDSKVGDTPADGLYALSAAGTTIRRWRTPPPARLLMGAK